MITYKRRKFAGWLLISLALGISVYANYNCSFGCQGVYGQVLNPLSMFGLILYIVGTMMIFWKYKEESEYV